MESALLAILITIGGCHLYLYRRQHAFGNGKRNRQTLFAHLFDLMWCGLLWINWEDATLWHHFALIFVYIFIRHKIQPGLALRYQLIWAFLLALSAGHILTLWLVWFALDCLKITVLPALLSRMAYSETKPADSSLSKAAQQLTNIPVVIACHQDHANARMEGIGPFKRILLMDGLLNKLNQAETLSVIAHEIGHSHHHHILKYQLLRGVLSLAVVLTFMQVSQDVTSLIILAPAIGSLALPILNGFKRSCEYQADAYVAQKNDAVTFTQALDKLHQHNCTAEQNDALYSLVYNGHPDPVLRKEKLK